MLKQYYTVAVLTTSFGPQKTFLKMVSYLLAANILVVLLQSSNQETSYWCLLMLIRHMVHPLTMSLLFVDEPTRQLVLA